MFSHTSETWINLKLIPDVIMRLFCTIYFVSRCLGLGELYSVIFTLTCPPTICLNKQAFIKVNLNLSFIMIYISDEQHFKKKKTLPLQKQKMYFYSEIKVYWVYWVYWNILPILSPSLPFSISHTIMCECPQ